MKPITWFKGVVVAIAMLGLTLQPAIGQELPAETDNPPSELELQAQVAEDPSLHFLLFMGRYDQALEAMVRTADLNALDSEGNTPLTIAARDQSADAYDMVEALLRHGAKPEERDADGRTALHYAVEAGTLSVVQLLVDRYGVDVNAPRLDADGEPIGSEVPVIGALLSGNQRIAKFLEERGADTPKLTPRQNYRSIKEGHFRRLTSSQKDPRFELSPDHRTRVKDSAEVEATTLALSEMGAPDILIRHTELKLKEFYRLLRDPETRKLDGPERWRRAKEHADSRVDPEAHKQAVIAFARKMAPDGGEL